MQHVEIPHELDNLKLVHTLEHGDKIIYAALRNYMNKDSRECFPAIRFIAENLQCSPTKVQLAIKRLLATRLLEKAKDGRKNHYRFPETDFDKQFEMFTKEFLYMDLPLNVKEYYMDIQQYLYGKDTGKGKCSFSNAELARRTGWTVASVKKYNTILIEKNLLEEETSDYKDEAGFPIIIKRFDLQGLNQAELWVKQVTAAVIRHEDEIQQLKNEIQELRSDRQEDKRKIAALEKQLALQNNYVKEVPNIDISKECK